MESPSPERNGPFRLLGRRCGVVHELALFEDCGCGCLVCPHGTPPAPSGTQASFDHHAQSRGAFDSPDALGLDRQLPLLVRQWLAEHPEERPSFVTLGFSTEPFPGFAEVDSLLAECLEPLLAAGIGVSLQTRRLVPEPILELLGAHAAKVRVTIPLPFLSNEELRTWEPGTASVEQRLFNVQQLRLRRIPVAISLGPLIPYVNDDSEHLTPLIRAVADAGVRRLSAEFMRLSQASRTRLEAHSPVSTQLIFGAYVERQLDLREDRSRPGISRRRRVYRLIAQLAREQRVRFELCRCMDPVLGRQPCLLWPGDASAPETQPTRHERARSRRRPLQRNAQVGFSGLLDSKR